MFGKPCGSVTYFKHEPCCRSPVRPCRHFTHFTPSRSQPYFLDRLCPRFRYVFNPRIRVIENARVTWCSYLGTQSTNYTQERDGAQRPPAARPSSPARPPSAGGRPRLCLSPPRHRRHRRQTGHADPLSSNAYLPHMASHKPAVHAAPSPLRAGPWRSVAASSPTLPVETLRVLL